ncbi:TPA: hypothetical protein SLN72_000162 [Morganella morganii]|nr:hypothetical protein [Morganella morganii]
MKLDLLPYNCALRRLGWEPYELNEYLTMLIRIDDWSLKSEIEELGKKNMPEVQREIAGGGVLYGW